MERKKINNIYSSQDYKRLEHSLSVDFDDIYIDSQKKVDHEKNIILSKLGVEQIESENSLMSNVIDSFIDVYRDNKDKLDKLIDSNSDEDEIDKIDKIDKNKNMVNKDNCREKSFTLENDDRLNSSILCQKEISFNSNNSSNDNESSGDDYFGCFESDINNIIPYIEDPYDDIGVTDICQSEHPNLVVGFNESFKKKKKSISNNHIKMFALSGVFMYGCAMFSRMLQPSL